MKKEDIVHLAALSRIRLTEEEVEGLEKELPKIVEYVSVITSIIDESDTSEKKVGARYNVFRKDEISNKPNEFTEKIITEMPTSEGRYMAVKKILKSDN